jgi:hypothetical protein
VYAELHQAMLVQRQLRSAVAEARIDAEGG